MTQSQIIIQWNGNRGGSPAHVDFKCVHMQIFVANLQPTNQHLDKSELLQTHPSVQIQVQTHPTGKGK